jgi:hypothetical protein
MGYEVDRWGFFPEIIALTVILKISYEMCIRSSLSGA